MNDPCQISLALNILGGKWKGQIIWWTKDEPKRFNELRRLIPEVTPKVLSSQLSQLVNHGLLKRIDYAENPPKVEYTATALCKSLIPILNDLSKWSKTNLT